MLYNHCFCLGCIYLLSCLYYIIAWVCACAPVRSKLFCEHAKVIINLVDISYWLHSKEYNPDWWPWGNGGNLPVSPLLTRRWFFDRKSHYHLLPLWPTRESTSFQPFSRRYLIMKCGLYTIRYIHKLLWL